MSAKRLPTCRHCGRKFKPCVYNRHHQKWCDHPECRAERDRARNRRYHRRRLSSDETFRQSERERCRESMRRSRQAAKGVEIADSFSTVPADVVLAGMVSQLVDSIDPQVVGQAMNFYAERGRNLAIPSRIRGSPGV